ncbi:hypothetical protein S40288_09797 [Stachybotrys chartarum IBT 40288]|nr:hypothetical protein S40288_09797 [Stachybotrys chartarum IBT 40288]
MPTTTPPPPVPSGISSSIDSDTSLNVLDLELMCHWTTSTYATLTHDPALLPFWRQNIVTIGRSCPFVMRSILSLSALHLAHLSPGRERELVEKSIICQQQARKEASAVVASVHRHSPPEVVENSFCYSLLTMFIVLANSPPPGDGALAQSNSDSAPDWIRIYGGVHELGLLCGPALNLGQTVSPIGIFAVRRFKLGEHAKNLNHPYLDHLKAQLNSAEISPNVRMVYDRAINELYAAFAVFFCEIPGESPDAMDLFLWLTKVMVDFIPLLRNNSQEALAIFGYFCMLPTRLPQRWWLTRWAENLKPFTHELLDVEHQRWVVEPSTDGNCV